MSKEHFIKSQALIDNPSVKIRKRNQSISNGLFNFVPQNAMSFLANWGIFQHRCSTALAISQFSSCSNHLSPPTLSFAVAGKVEEMLSVRSVCTSH